MEEKSLRIILTGSTGMVGEGVLQECLNHPDVEKVLVLNRKSCGINHPRLVEILHGDFLNLDPVKKDLTGYNACLFCLGVSSVGMKEELYFRLTHSLTMHLAEILSSQNPGMVFCYISGAGTDSTERGGSMWARVKGKTENDLMKLPFRKVYAFRPAIIQPEPGLKNTLSMYKWMGWLLPVVKTFFPRYLCTLKQLGLAMIAVSLKGYDKQVLEVPDIIRIAGS